MSASPVPVRITGDHSEKAYTAQIDVAQKRLHLAAKHGVAVVNLILPKSGVTIDADGNATAAPWAVRGKLAAGVLTGDKALTIFQRAKEAQEFGAVALVREGSHADDAIRCVAEAPATPEGIAYAAKCARATGKPEIYRVLFTAKPVEWRTFTDTLPNGKTCTGDQASPDMLDRENPGWSIRTVDEVAPKPKAGEPDGSDMQERLDRLAAAEAGQCAEAGQAATAHM